MKKIITHSEEETKKIASQIASEINGKKVIVLNGELGAGKTKFTEGILSYFGLQQEISSPTFTIVNEYHSNKIDIYHFDLYRLTDIYEFENIGGEEYFNKGICIFEWGELIEDILPENYIKITFDRSNTDENIRKLVIETFGKKFENIDFTKFK